MVPAHHSMILYKDRVCKDELNFSFANRVIVQWNKLPETVVHVNAIRLKITWIHF